MRFIGYIEGKTSPGTVILLIITSAVLGALIITMFFGQIKLDPDATMDSLNYYSSDQFYSYIDIQGQEGRRGYLQLHVIDYLFITQFYTLFIFIISSLSRGMKNRKIKSLCLVPLLPAAMDLLENISIDISILVYPEKISPLGKAAGVFTFIKMYAIYLVFIIIILLLVLKVIRKFRRGGK